MDEDDHLNCSICLQPLVDRTLIPSCSHEFCFECILVWTEQSRRCPLCSQSISTYLIHHIRSKHDYQKHYLPPLLQQLTPRPRQRTRQRQWGRRQLQEIDEADQLERAITKRRWIYQHGLYAKHVASNPYTRYKPYPTPAQFSASPDLISRTTMFLRRELRVWIGLDVEFLTTFIISLMKSIDIRSESAVKLIAEFLDMDGGVGDRKNAEHFAHELYCYLRSPFRDLTVYDSVVQYDTPADLPPPIEFGQSTRWRVSRSRDRLSSRSRSPNRREDTADSRARSRASSLSPYPSRSLSRSRSPNRIEDTADSRAQSRSPSRSRYPSRSLSRSRSPNPIENPVNSHPNKGKQRQSPSPPTPVSSADADTPLDSKAPPPPRPPRNRNLLESVHAHLRLPSHSNNHKFDDDNDPDVGRYSAPEIMARTRARLASAPSSSITNSAPPPDVTSQAERKLRQRAHLRVKLAAAKRDVEREESLRAKLKGRKRQLHED